MKFLKNISENKKQRNAKKLKGNIEKNEKRFPKSVKNISKKCYKNVTWKIIEKTLFDEKVFKKTISKIYSNENFKKTFKRSYKELFSRQIDYENFIKISSKIFPIEICHGN